MLNVSNKVKNVSESETLAMARLSREFKEKGLDVIGLSLGEPDFNTPDFIKEAAIKALDDNITKYSPVPGFLSLREAIVTKLKRDNGLSYNASQIVVSTGAKQTLANLCMSLLNPGDEVLLPAPYWVTYKEVIKLAGGIPVVIPTTIENNFKVTAQQLEEHITAKTRMLLYSSPSNPTGSIYTKQELKNIADLLVNHKEIAIVSDEIYEHINFTGAHESIAQFNELKDQVIVVNGVSKAFAMTGWRLGWMAGPEHVAQACTKIQGQITSGTCTISQMAAQAAMLAEPKAIKYMKTSFAKRKNVLLSLLNEIEGIKTYTPEGAFYLFPEVNYYYGKSFEGKAINNSKDLCMYLLNEALVSLVPGEAFEAPNSVRISYAASEEQIKEAVKRIKVALKKLQ